MRAQELLNQKPPKPTEPEVSTEHSEISHEDIKMESSDFSFNELRQVKKEAHDFSQSTTPLTATDDYFYTGSTVKIVINTHEHNKKDQYYQTKNISKNYCKAMINFVSSELSRPYLKTLFENCNESINRFLDFTRSNKSKIKNLYTLGSLIMVSDSDSEMLKKYKQALHKLCKVFMDDYSMNWIMSSKLAHKQLYVEWRSKMIDRIQYPEKCSYIRRGKI